MTVFEVLVIISLKKLKSHRHYLCVLCWSDGLCVSHEM